MPFVDRLAARTPLLILAYFGLHAALRAAVPGALGLDEAQAVLHAQSADWGYGPQPPLYAWLQIAVFQIAGPSKLGLALLKNALLAAALLSVWRVMKASGASDRVAMVGALAILLIPGVGWESQRALTHTPLALAACAAALPAFLWARRGGGPAAHLVLGLLLGVGLISKLNAAFFAAGLLAAFAFAPRPRPVHLALTVLTALAVLAPHAWWALGNAAASTSGIGKLGVDEAGPLARRAAGLAAFAVSIVAALGLAAVAFAALGLRRAEPPEPTAVDPAARADLARVLAFATAATLAGVFAAGASEVKERWLTPVLFLAPPVAALWLAPRITAVRALWFARGAAALMVVILFAAQVYFRWGDGRPPRQATPFQVLAPQIAGLGATALGESDWIAGNLAFAAPGLVALSPGAPGLRVATPGPVALVWSARRGEAPPRALLALAEDRFGAPAQLGRTRRFEAPLLWPHDGSFALMAAPLLGAPASAVAD